ncbi:MAG: F0F1 ATP synthase subunit A [Pirellulales bacterium]|nr:F0F1 ATP synthase subunit A [Pirellulales bacterium]MBL7193392.1 F0F1 ATP synthase subunit A [Pirellulales bacterium]
MSDHNPIYHLKDAYFFEVPKPLWPRDWQTLDEVPEFLRRPYDEAGEPMPAVEEFNEAMSGKVLIPQPFADLDSLYAVRTGLGISKYMILELLLAAILYLVFTRLAGQLSSGAPAKGRLANLFEAFILYIRDQIARPAIDSHSSHEHGDHGNGDHGHGHHGVAVLAAHEGDRFVPLLLTLFFFVLGCNLLGMVPWAGSPTASFSVTLVLAGVTFGTVIVAGMMQFGPLGFFANQVPSMDLPRPLGFVLKPAIFVIEMLGMCIKHLILAVRLLANMVAGHLVLLGIMGMISAAASYSFGMWATVTGISVVSSTLFSVLELFVAFLQAYIFTTLSALFIGASVQQH